MNTEISKELIFDYLLNKSTPLQIKQIEVWLILKSNEEQFYKWLEEWELKHFEYIPDTDGLLVKYQSFILQNPHQTQINVAVENHPNSSSPFRSNMKWMIRLAAVVVIALLTFTGYLLRENVLFQTYKNESAQTKSLILADGSQVSLKSNGMIQLPRWGFALDQREVYLTGEAEFQVTHAPNHKPFVVKTAKGIDVKVLGTEFSVHSLTNETIVALKNGSVQLFYIASNEKKNIIMKPGELAFFNNKNQVVLTKPLPKRFLFNDTPLSEVAKSLESAFGITVRIEGKETANLTLMGSFSTESSDEFIEVICELLQLKATKNGSIVTFSKVKN